jgi:hypothetical protein
LRDSAEGFKGKNNESGIHDLQKHREIAQLSGADDGQQTAEDHRHHPQGQHQRLGTDQLHQGHRHHPGKQHSRFKLIR